MKRLIARSLVFAALVSAQARAVPLETLGSFSTDHAEALRRGQISILTARGTGTDSIYVVEVDPTTGALPVTGSFSFTDPAIGPTGDPVPTEAQLQGGDNAGTLRAMVVDSSGRQIVAGGGTAGTPTGGVLSVQGVASGTPIPASQSGTWNITNISGTVSLPTGAATAAKQDTGNSSLASIDTNLQDIESRTPNLGQAAMAGSVPVAIATNQSAVPVTATALDIRPLDSLTDNVEAIQGGVWSVDLDAGAQVEATNLPATVDTGSGAAGASTLRSVLATRHEAASTPLSVRISDGSNFAVPSPKGRSSVTKVSQDLSSVTTSAYTQIVGSTSADINVLSAFESSGQGLILATGASSSEVDVLYIPPGGFGHTVPLYVPSGTRLSIKALLGNPSDGRLVANFLN